MGGGNVNNNLVTISNHFLGLAANNSYIYWSNGNNIARADLDGNNINYNFITNANSPLGLAVNSANIYWLNGANIGRADLDGGNPTNSLITTNNQVVGIATNSVKITIPDIPENTAKPQITGTPQSGFSLSCSKGNWSNSPGNFDFYWKLDNNRISDADTSVYTPKNGDIGHLLSCSVTASNQYGNSTASSEQLLINNCLLCLRNEQIAYRPFVRFDSDEKWWAVNVDDFADAQGNGGCTGNPSGNFTCSPIYSANDLLSYNWSFEDHCWYSGNQCGNNTVRRGFYVHSLFCYNQNVKSTGTIFVNTKKGDNIVHAYFSHIKSQTIKLIIRQHGENPAPLIQAKNGKTIKPIKTIKISTKPPLPPKNIRIHKHKDKILISFVKHAPRAVVTLSATKHGLPLSTKVISNKHNKQKFSLIMGGAKYLNINTLTSDKAPSKVRTIKIPYIV